MNTFPFPTPEFSSEADESPLWRPAPGRTYYMPLSDTELEVKVWNGGVNDLARREKGLVFRSQFAAAEMRRWMVAMGKLWKYATLFHVEGVNHFHHVEVMHQALVVCEDGRPTLLPRFATKELATLALDRLSEAEKQTLIGGPQWT